ncbi:MAG: hypothetical protein ACK42Y_03420 [Candidatus Thermochlorobacter sp.]
MKPAYRPNFEKFLNTLSPEQMMFLGALIEQDMQAKDYANMDYLADLMYQRTQHLNHHDLQQATLERFFDPYFPIV